MRGAALDAAKPGRHLFLSKTAHTLRLERYALLLSSTTPETVNDMLTLRDRCGTPFPKPDLALRRVTSLNTTRC